MYSLTSKTKIAQWINFHLILMGSFKLKELTVYFMPSNNQSILLLLTGTLGYVHFTCLEGWLNQASRDYCELCHFRFQASQSRRYSMLQSLWIWVSNRTNRTYLCYDALIALVLTALTVAIVFICLVKLDIRSCCTSF